MKLMQQYHLTFYSAIITSNVTAVTDVRSASFGLVLHAQHTLANSVNFLVTLGLLVTIFHSTCIFCVYIMALYCPTLQFYRCMHKNMFVCQYVAPPHRCYYNSLIMLQRLFSIAKCGIMRSLKVWASSSSTRLPLCQILFLSWPPLLS